MDYESNLDVTLPGCWLNLRSQANYRKQRLTARKASSDSRPGCLYQQRWTVTDGHHLSIHSVDTHTLFINKPERSRRIRESGIPTETLCKNIVGRYPADKPTGGDGGQRGIGLNPSHGRRFLQIPITVHHSVEYGFSS